MLARSINSPGTGGEFHSLLEARQMMARACRVATPAACPAASVTLHHAACIANTTQQYSSCAHLRVCCGRGERHPVEDVVLWEQVAIVDVEVLHLHVQQWQELISPRAALVRQVCEGKVLLEPSPGNRIFDWHIQRGTCGWCSTHTGALN
jgi:hypothetical protein